MMRAARFPIALSGIAREPPSNARFGPAALERALQIRFLRRRASGSSPFGL